MLESIINFSQGIKYVAADIGSYVTNISSNLIEYAKHATEQTQLAGYQILAEHPLNGTYNVLAETEKPDSSNIPLWVGFIPLGLFVVGIPAAVLYVRWYKNKRINNPNDKNNDS